MKKFALAMSLALVFGVSASALASVSFSGVVDGETTSQWSSDTSKSKAGDTVVPQMKIDINLKGSGSGNNTEKTGSYSYSANLNGLVTDGNAATTGATVSLAEYKAEVKDPLFTIAIWGRKQSYTAKSDTFGWIKSDGVKNSAGSDSGNEKFRFQLAKYDASVDFDDNKTGWGFYSTKLGTATVGLAAATKTAGAEIEPTASYALYGSQEVIPGVTVQGELALTTGDSRKLSQFGANGAAGVKVDYKVSDALTTNAFVSARGEKFAEFNTNRATFNDRLEAGVGGTYKAGAFTYTLAYADAQHTNQRYKNAKGDVVKYEDDAASSASIQWVPTTGLATGLNTKLSYAVTTADKVSENAAVHTWTLTATKKFLADKLSVTANYKQSFDEDLLDPGTYKNALDTDVIGKYYTWYNDNNVTAAYTIDTASSTVLTVTLLNLSAKAKNIDDYYTKEYVKLSRKVGSATVAAEYTSTNYDVDRKPLVDTQIQDALTKLSLSIPL